MPDLACPLPEANHTIVCSLRTTAVDVLTPPSGNP